MRDDLLHRADRLLIEVAEILARVNLLLHASIVSVLTLLVFGRFGGAWGAVSVAAGVVGVAVTLAPFVLRWSWRWAKRAWLSVICCELGVIVVTLRLGDGS